MSTTSQLEYWMRFQPTFRGVFPLDGIPHLQSGIHDFIVNTHTKNLKGEHWMAVKIIDDHAWIFDPLAISLPPTLLLRHLSMYCSIRHFHYTSVNVQPLNRNSCGHHCVYFLYLNQPAPSELYLHKYINNLK